MNEYKRKHIGMISLNSESHPGMVVQASVDNIGKVIIELGNSMTVRVNYSDATRIINLIEDCTSLLTAEGLHNKSDFPICNTEKELRENVLRARRSAMEVPVVSGSNTDNVRKLSQMQRVDPFDSESELGNDPRE